MHRIPVDSADVREQAEAAAEAEAQTVELGVLVDQLRRRGLHRNLLRDPSLSPHGELPEALRLAEILLNASDDQFAELNQAAQGLAVTAAGMGKLAREIGPPDPATTAHTAGCVDGWAGEDDEGRPRPCLACRPHLANVACRTCSALMVACVVARSRAARDGRRGGCCDACTHPGPWTGANR